MNTFNADEQAAATAISNMQNSGCEKRGRDDGADDAAGVQRPAKLARPVVTGRELRPAPYYYYRDHSMEVDPDPLTPLTAPGRCPNFPAKMHAILSRKEFEDVIAWLPHGRSWRVLKPREFEVKIIPKFFEHAKFSSFVRQANGWGFRRITQGKDRNSYYHEKFLRGLPHLCKTMKRPGVNEKKQADPEHEPDLYKISEEHPVPERADDDSVLLHCTMQGGPKARMPIYWGSMAAASTTAPVVVNNAAPVTMVTGDQTGSPMNVSPVASTPPATKQVMTVPSFLTLPTTTTTTPTAGAPMQTVQVAAQPANFAAFTPMAFQMPTMHPAASAQFAAGFAAATAFSQQHFHSVLGSLAAQKSVQQQQQVQVQYPQQPQTPSS